MESTLARAIIATHTRRRAIDVFEPFLKTKKSRFDFVHVFDNDLEFATCRTDLTFKCRVFNDDPLGSQYVHLVLKVNGDTVWRASISKGKVFMDMFTVDTNPLGKDRIELLADAPVKVFNLRIRGRPCPYTFLFRRIRDCAQNPGRALRYNRAVGLKCEALGL
jgi:hypothetical protein